MTTLLLALFGIAVGTYGALVGIGGGFVVVPFLLLAYRLSPPAAAATSLVVVSLNAISGSITYLLQRRVDVRAGLALAAATIPGALVGPAITERMPERTFKVTFALLLIALAVFLLLRPERAPGRTPRETKRAGWWIHQGTFTDRAGATSEYSFNILGILVLSFAVGVLASMLGVGGGIIHVPAMIHIMSFPVHIATATSTFVLGITSLAAVFGYSARGHIVWSLAGSLGLGVILGAQIGAAVSQWMRGRGIVRLLTIAVMYLAARLLWSAAA